MSRIALSATFKDLSATSKSRENTGAVVDIRGSALRSAAKKSNYQSKVFVCRIIVRMRSINISIFKMLVIISDWSADPNGINIADKAVFLEVI